MTQDPPGYGQPAPEYGQPAAPQYGQPAAPQYGQQPSYGTPAPDYGTPAPNYGQPPAPEYGQPPAPPGYGQPPPPPAYGQPPAPEYGQPPAPPGYGQPPPPPAYGQTPPPPGYGQQTPYGAPGYGAPVANAPLSPAEERQWGMLGHLSGIITGFVGPLIIFLVFKDRGPYAKDQTTEALNWQITMMIGWVAYAILVIPLTLAHLGIIGTLLWWALILGNLALCVMGGLAANKGESYRYPFALRLVK